MVQSYKLVIFVVCFSLIFSKNWARVLFVNSRAPRRSVIYPGTKWCGSGNIATNYDDLGEDRDLDLCCREHDSCPEFIEAGQTKYGLTNTASYTRLHCPCDDKFYKCLRRNAVEKNSTSSNMVGYIYFNRLKTQCYAFDHPIVRCKTQESDASRCKEYLLDATSPEIWQWFDVPLF